MWYDINQTLSYNCLFNFIVGQRGVGKTYACKRKAIKNFLNKGDQFVYLRRYDTELKAGQLENFFSDIQCEFPDTEFAYQSGKFYIDDHVAGYAIPLSKSAQYKSVPFPQVSMIIFDEFIIDQGLIRYLPNEVITFNEMYSTIARLRDVIVMFLSNAITFTNPYFLFFDLKLQQGQSIVRKGDILLQLVDNIDYQQKASSTRFGKIIAGTDYGRYAIQNEFLRDTNEFIEKIPAPGTALFLLNVKDERFCVYSVIGSNNWYVSEALDKTCKRNISMDLESHNQNTIMKGDKSAILWIEELRQKFFRAELRFTTMKAKNLVSEVIKYRR